MNDNVCKTHESPVRVIIITGAGSLIGREVVKEALNENYCVCASVNNSLQEFNDWAKASNLTASHLKVVHGDLTQPEAVERLFVEADALGSLSGLVNGIGDDCGRHSVFDTNRTLLDKAIQSNFLIASTCIQHAIQRMKQNQRGSIVSIASDIVSSGGRRLAHYAAAKAALVSYSHAISRELAEFGIRVNCVSPGITKSKRCESPETGHLPMRRAAEPSEISNSILWLLSEKSSYVTGTNIVVAGGK